MLATVQSLKRARRLLDELAVEGQWKPGEYGECSIVYTRVMDSGQVEELTIYKKGERHWEVVRQTKEVVTRETK